MKVKVADFKPSGIRVEGSLPLGALNERMDEGANNEIHFLEAPVFDLTIYGTPQGAETHGKIRARYRQPCSRCLKDIDIDIERETHFVLKPIGALPEGHREEDDAFVIYYKGDYVDLEDALQETLILALSPFLLPEAGQDGNCSVCGLKVEKELSVGPKDEGTARTLEALFKKAGLK